MFNSSDRNKAVSADLTLSDGRKLKGKMIMPISSDLMRLLNSDTNFIEFETHSGVRSVIARSAIVEVLPTEIPKVRQLNSNLEDDVRQFQVPHQCSRVKAPQQYDLVFQLHPIQWPFRCILAR